MATLSTIERNISKVGRILGRSHTVGKIPSKRKKPYITGQGKKLIVGAGKDSVVAINQRQANLLNMAQKHSQSGFKLKDLFNHWLTRVVEENMTVKSRLFQRLQKNVNNLQNKNERSPF